MPSFYDIYACIAFEHDARMLAAAIFVCAIGAAVSFALWRQISESTEAARRRLLFVLAVLTAACSVWATHFVAMLGYVQGLDQAISVPWTVASLLLAIVLYTVAASALVRARRGTATPWLASASLTVAVTGMHYTGIQAFRESAVLIWDPGYVALSVAASLTANHAAARVFVARRDLGAVLGGAGCFSAGIVCLHFVGMAALTLLPYTPAGATGSSAVWLTEAIVLAVVVIAFGGAVAIAFDRFAVRRQVAEAERLRRLADELRAANDEANRANAELIQARDQAEQATRSKSRFLAMMSHEIRTPINGVLGMAEALSAMPLSAEHRECVSVIQSSGRTLLAIINDILDISKLEQSMQSFASDRFDLRETLEDVAALAAPLAEEKGIRLHLRVPRGVCTRVTGDESRIRQIATNLVGNAIKFTERGHVLIEIVDPEGEDALILRVRDSGSGIEAAQLERVFEAFFQTRTSVSDPRGGTGLGLAIGRTLARQMGGDLTATSRVGEGSTFTLTLPAARWAPDRAETPEPLGRIAVWADDPLDRQIVCDLIEECGAHPLPCGPAGAVAPEGVVGAVICHAPGTGEPKPAACPVLRIVPPSALSRGTAALNETRVLRPVRLARLAAWLAAPVTAETGERGPVPAAAPAPAAGAGRILVVDDSATNRLVVKRLLRGEGFEFVDAVNGEEACRISAEEDFACILMDVAMPVMDGLDATAAIRDREARRSGPRTPIFGLTAHVFEEDCLACFGAGMDDVATKPVSKATLMSLLGRCGSAGSARSAA